MKPRTQNLIGCGVFIFLIFVGVIGYGGYKTYSALNEIGGVNNEDLPSQIKEAKILKGENFLAKTELFNLKKSSFWETIIKGATAKDEKEKQKIINSETSKNFYGFADIRVVGNEIIAVGNFGGYVFDLSGNSIREFLFEPQEGKMSVFRFEKTRYYSALDELQIVDLSKDKTVFLTHKSIYGVNVYDLNGKTIWKFGNQEPNLLKEKTATEKEIYVTEVEVVDLDDDGLSEYIISQKNDGIRVFDQKGNEKWFQPDEFPTAKFRLVDIEGDGNTELLEFQGGSSAIRDKKTGNILKKLKIDGGKKLLPLENTQQNKPARFFEFDENKLKISDFTNKTIWESDAPLSTIKREKPKTGNPYSNNTERVYQPKAVWVSLQKDKPKYLAIVGSFISFPRSNFYLYDEKGTLVYHELLPEEAETIAVLPNESGNESILIGGKDTIWKFSAN